MGDSLLRYCCNRKMDAFKYVRDCKYFTFAVGSYEPNDQFLGDANIALYTSMGVNIWKWFPFIAVTLLASLQSVDESLIDAARIDGCNVFQRFRYVLFPHMRVTISVTALLMTFWNFNTFGLIWLLTTGGPSDATTTLPVLAYKTAFQSFRMGRASSLSVIMLLLLLVFAVAYRRLSAKNENAME